MATFSGQLRQNEIFSAIYNMLISQQVFADNINGADASLVDSARVDGTLFGDTKLYYATDVLKSNEWGADAEAANLLNLHRPAAPEVQAITLDQFRQISLTVDNYLTKRAFSDEGTFSAFNSVMLQWIRDTKKIYDITFYNTHFGCEETSEGNQSQEVLFLEAGDDSTEADIEAVNRMNAQKTAELIANIFVELKDVTRNYNDYGYVRSFDKSALKIVWNSAYVNQITKLDLPSLFHKDIMESMSNTMPARYFGKVNTATGRLADLVADGLTIRSYIEQDITTGSGTVHVFPGDLIPSGVTVIDISEAKPIVYPTYTEDSTIICKIIHRDSLPFMSAFEVGTSFFNAKSLTENHYLTWGYNTLEHLKNYPFITVRATVDE